MAALALSVVASGFAAEPAILLLGDAGYPPMTYLEKGEARGLAVELVRALEKPLGRPIRIELMDWRLAQEKALQGEADGVLEMSFSEERARNYDFATPIFLHSYGLFVRTSETRIRGASDLRDRRVGVTPGGFPRRFIESQFQMPVVPFDTYEQGLRSLAAGEIDAFAGDLWVGAYTIQTERIKGVTVIETPFASQSASIALRKGNPELLNAINRALDVLERDGTLAQITQRWKPEEMVFLTRGSVRSIVVWSVGVAVGVLLLLMGGWVWSLKRQIRVRREAELALRESNERIRSLSDNLPNGMIYQLIRERDGSRRFLHLSATVEKIHGVTVAEALIDADLLYRQLVREDRAIVEEAEARSARTGELFQLEVRIRNRQGDMRWIQLTSAPRTLSDGRVVWDGIEFDITARKSAEQVAQQSARELQMIFDHAPVGIALLKDRKFVRVNECQAAMLGYAPEEFAGQSARFIYPSQEDYEQVGGGIYNEITRDGQSVRETTFRCKNDSLVHLHLRVVPADRHDPFAGIISMSVDLTERKLVEEALRASEEKYRGIFENALEGIFQSSPQGRYLSVNPSMARMHGYDSPQDMIDSITDIATQIYANPSERQRVLGRIERDDRIDNYELHVRRKDGSEMWILSSLRAVRDLGGQIVYYEGTNIDITERKRMSALETSTLRAEAASRAKSAFLANMSHEIRTPMNAILGFSQLLMRDPDLSPAQREHLRVIDRNGEHLMALITDILEMSKIEANRATLNRSPFAVIGLARDLESMFRARIEPQGLSFLVETDESCEARLVGDVGKLRQIFVNLLANAIKFTTTGRIVLRLHAEPQLDDSWCLRGEVEDTGPGIPTAFLDELFDEFAQTDLGRRTGAGTGLGLPISREFARMMDGDITVETREGHGSTFRVAVILARASANQPADLDRSNGRTETLVRLAPDQPECRVLVVDDQPDSRQFLRLLLAEAGFVVREAANGVEAVATAASWRPHCILMDLRMPVMGGLEAIAEIRRHDHGLGMKIISLTASVFVEDRAQVLAAGADRFMMKPVHVSDLFEQISVLLDMKYTRSSQASGAAPEQGVFVSDRPSIHVPACLIGRLREAVEAADLDLVLALTDEVATIDEPTALEIRRIINRFDYPALLALLDASAEANA